MPLSLVGYRLRLAKMSRGLEVVDIGSKKCLGIRHLDELRIALLPLAGSLQEPKPTEEKKKLAKTVELPFGIGCILVRLV